ncbi:MAG: site-specific DNA-methyltransferase [Thaumarchaeota archaeon]|nr:site-specific DNA-methyltransferase [Nitrososphaerota archaeon]
MRDYGIKGQIGLEPDYREYVNKLVSIFVELQRVLKKDGSFYLNLGDTYSHSGGAGGQYHRLSSKNRIDGFKKYQGHRVKSLPPKCMIGIPWRIAFALIHKGWILRNDIIWHKPNALPSSVKDRLTNTYEHVFHFVKSRKYFYNLDAIRVPHKVVGVTDLRPPGILRQRLYERSRYNFSKDPHLKQYQGKFESDSEKFGSPRARRTRKEFQQRDYHPNGKNPGDVVNLTNRELTLIKFFRSKGSGGNPGHGIQGSTLGETHYLGKNPGDVLAVVQDATRPKADGVMKTGGMLPPPNVHKENPERLWNPKGKNPGDILKIDGVSFTRNVGRITRHEVEKAKSQPSKRILRWVYRPNPLGRRPGDFWIINTRGFKGAHFAVYPEELLRRPILSSSRVGDVVFDPFIGSGTTAVVARKLERRFLGCDINPEYVRMAEERLRGVLN